MKFGRMKLQPINAVRSLRRARLGRCDTGGGGGAGCVMSPTIAVVMTNSSLRKAEGGWPLRVSHGAATGMLRTDLGLHALLRVGDGGIHRLRARHDRRV